MSKELPHFSLKRYLYPIFMFPMNDIYLINKASNFLKVTNSVVEQKLLLTNCYRTPRAISTYKTQYLVIISAHRVPQIMWCNGMSNLG